MENTRKNNIAEAEAFGELESLEEFIISDSGPKLTVIIKHDYYSSDSDHGRDLLEIMLTALTDEKNRLSKLILTDSGILLISSDNPLSYAVKILQATGVRIFFCSESAQSFNISEADQNGFLRLSAYEIFLEMLENPNLIEIG